MSDTKIHPLYLTKINKDEKSLLIPEFKKNKYIFSKKNIKNEFVIDSNIDEIVTLDMGSKFLLNYIYNIKNWEDTYNFIKNNYKYNLEITLDRIIDKSWESFNEDYKFYLDKIFLIYKIILQNFFNYKYNETKLKKIIYSIKPNDLENIHKNIIQIYIIS